MLGAIGMVVVKNLVLIDKSGDVRRAASHRPTFKTNYGFGALCLRGSMDRRLGCEPVQELLDELIYVKFGMVKLKVIKQLVSDFIVGKNGIHMRSLKGERDVHVQINDSPCHAWSDCFITGSLQDCVAVSEEISVRLRRRLE